jgi:hypothetical protein
MKFGILVVYAKMNSLTKFDLVLMCINCLLKFYAFYGLIKYTRKVFINKVIWLGDFLNCLLTLRHQNNICPWQIIKIVIRI